MAEVKKVIFEKLQDAIAEQFSVQKNTVAMDTCFVDDLGADSLDLVELVSFMEEEFDVPTPSDDELEKMETVADAVAYISRFVEDE